MSDWQPWLQHQERTFQQVFARLVTHYWANGCFLDHAPIAVNMHRIAHIAAVLIHGRYDVSGPLDTAWDLHRAWPASRLVVLDDAGHGGTTMTGARRRSPRRIPRHPLAALTRRPFEVVRTRGACTKYGVAQ
jgi:hypothetical protein